MELFKKNDLKRVQSPDFNVYETVKRRENPTGIDKDRKKKLVKITNLMNENDKQYYLNLPETI